MRTPPAFTLVLIFIADSFESSGAGPTSGVGREPVGEVPRGALGRILDKIEWHYTPKHGSWLNMAESEISIMNSQCLDRRLDSVSAMAAELAPWEAKCNARHARMHWTFTLAVARQKFRKLYPSNEV